MRKILLTILVLTGIGFGVSGGYGIRNAALSFGEEAAPSGKHKTNRKDREGEDHKKHNSEFVKMEKQFVVPIVDRGVMKKIAVISLSLEVDSDEKENVYAARPELRDAFLQVLFSYASDGGFDGAFTSRNRMAFFRKTLRQAARRIAGKKVKRVLVTDLVVQAR